MSSLRTLRRWWRGRGPYLRWKLAHPGGRYREWYVEQVVGRLDGGEAGAVPGENGVGTERYRETGRLFLERLRREGLEPSMRLVDYGCGDLRIGRPAIEYLDRDRYLGLDLIDRFYREALATLDPDLVERRRPRFAVIDEATLQREAARPPDFLISIDVAIHVPRAEIDEYLDRVSRLVGPRTRVLMGFHDADQHRPAGDLTWTWPAAELLAACRRHGLAGEAFELGELPLPVSTGCRNALLRLGRSVIR